MAGRSIHYFILSMIVAQAALTGAAAEPFRPWNADVLVGDACLAQDSAHRSARPEAKERGRDRTHRAVYNGFQGGAYFLLRFFQVAISPQDGPSCRFHPVCSAYAKQAVDRFGALPGSIMAGDRILRCNPFNKPGPDPVPRNILEP